MAIFKNRHLYFMITACVVMGISPLLFSARSELAVFLTVALAVLFLQVYWRDLLVQLHIIKGRFAAARGDRPAVEKSYRKVFQLMPHSFAGKMAMGVIHTFYGRWKEAESFFRQAIYLRPGNLYACLNLAVTLIRSEQYREADKLLSALIYAYPRCAQAYVSLAEACYYLGRVREAANYLLVAVQLGAGNPEVTGFLKNIERELEKAA